jgi:hypothetical protein
MELRRAGFYTAHSLIGIRRSARAYNNLDRILAQPLFWLSSFLCFSIRLVLFALEGGVAIARGVRDRLAYPSPDLTTGLSGFFLLGERPAIGVYQ